MSQHARDGGTTLAAVIQRIAVVDGVTLSRIETVLRRILDL